MIDNTYIQIPIITYQDEDGIYIAYSPALEGFHTYGSTLSILTKRLIELKALYRELIACGEIKFSQNRYISLWYEALDTWRIAYTLPSLQTNHVISCA